MDPEAFLDLANQVIKLKMYPYFDIAHSLLCALSVREDLGTGAQAFSRKHPLSCWLSTMYVVFYTPFDVGYKVAKFLPVKVVAATMKEIYRAKKVYDGVSHAAKLYPNAYIIMIIIGEHSCIFLSSILLGIHDPFVPFENLFSALFLGGIWDSLAKLLGKGQPKEETKDSKKTN
ncbi:unnamed protein product [Leptidea sinapis]|uniref:Trimeric intracellular cation channel type B n=1 Tax=Leptidea sinapis TaxID=189913 RepID=A0A5E4R2Z2_9NEOP|nr:unnamed protein product [Leptidea sinapis]